MRKKVLMVVLVLITALSFSQSILTMPAQEKEKLAFPYNMAGFGVWIKLDKAPDFKIVGAFLNQLVDVSDNHILGWTTRETLRGIRAYVYADVNGYLVVFLHKDTPPANIIDFSQVDFVKREVRSFTILKLMESILRGLGYDYAKLFPQISFVDFQYPEANSFFLAFTTTGDSYECYLHFAISSEAYVYSISILALGIDYRSGVRILLDESVLLADSVADNYSKYLFRIVDGKSTGIDPTKPHTLSFRNIKGHLAVLVVCKK